MFTSKSIVYRPHRAADSPHYLPITTITYQQGFTGEPSTFFEGEMDLSLADDVVGLIDDMENGLYLPDNITDVEVVNSMPDDPDEARRGWEKAEGAHDKAQDQLEDPLCTFAEVFENSTGKLEKLSRYETTIERRLRHAMQDLERLQAARKAEAAEAATVIDITDVKQEAS